MVVDVVVVAEVGLTVVVVEVTVEVVVAAAAQEGVKEIGPAPTQTVATRTSHGGLHVIAARRRGQRAWEETEVALGAEDVVVVVLVIAAVAVDVVDLVTEEAAGAVVALVTAVVAVGVVDLETVGVAGWVVTEEVTGDTSPIDLPGSKLILRVCVNSLHPWNNNVVMYCTYCPGQSRRAQAEAKKLLEACSGVGRKHSLWEKRGAFWKKTFN